MYTRTNEYTVPYDTSESSLSRVYVLSRCVLRFREVEACLTISRELTEKTKVQIEPGVGTTSSRAE